MYNSNRVVSVLLNSTYEVMVMYVVKVFHGYIDKTGHRTRDKSSDNLLVFPDRKSSEEFANKIGGRVKRLEEVKV